LLTLKHARGKERVNWGGILPPELGGLGEEGAAGSTVERKKEGTIASCSHRRGKNKRLFPERGREEKDGPEAPPRRDQFWTKGRRLIGKWASIFFMGGGKRGGKKPAVVAEKRGGGGGDLPMTSSSWEKGKEARHPSPSPVGKGGKEKGAHQPACRRMQKKEKGERSTKLGGGEDRKKGRKVVKEEQTLALKGKGEKKKREVPKSKERGEKDCV